MATAKLWWNGSSWSTSSAYWLDGNTWASSAYCFIVYKAQIIAYDDGTLQFVGSVTPNDTGSTHALSGTKTFSLNGSTFTTFGQSNRYRTLSISVSSYPFTMSYSGNMSVYKMQSGTYYGQPWNASGSTSVPNPFLTITYMANNEVFDTQSGCIGATMNILETTPTKKNYQFLGWSTDPDATIPDYEVGAEFTPTQNMILYAVWKIDVMGCRIDNGETWDLYLIYIDNGISWDMYMAYRDNGISWDMLC